MDDGPVVPLVFDGEVAVVTGAAGGLGRAHALLLAERGCRVVVNDVGLPHGDDVPSAATVVAEIVAAGGEATTDSHDVVTDGAAVVDTALGAYGRVDIVVNNAGIGAGGPIGPGVEARWRPTIDVTLRGSIAVTAAAWPHLAAAPAGRVVMTSSPSMFGASTTPPYSAAKSALYGLTRSLAGQGRRDGIGVNAIMPSAWTRLTRSLPAGPMAELFAARYPPEDVASFVAWLCHPSCTVSGESFSVGAGRAARVVLGENRGVVLEDREPARWAAAVDELMATDEVVFPRSMNDEVTWQAHTLGGDLPEALAPGGALHWARRPR
ncbi:MAG: SDR family NAD(P)-dependent oxidoreductase [Acidimicrobiales bacterium]|nr:SDR family NAD(P)-dependent oxidoreductase [Acidimicrobiales bacterium]